MIPFNEQLQELTKYLRTKLGIRVQAWPTFILGLALLTLAFVFMYNVVLAAISISLFLAPLWLPMIVVWGAWTMWVILKRSEYIHSQTYVLLEIKPPRSLSKTPLAMEAMLAGLHLNPGEGTWYKKYIKGAVRPYWSLEIASLEGQVHFYIWTRVGFRKIIEAQIYAQYPGAAVVEVPDYTRMITATPHDWTIWGCDFEHSKPDPYPIKTYVEYGLDKTQKEFEQVDPLSNLVEFLGTLGKNEYMWVQYVIRAHKGEKYHGHHGWKDWKDEAKAIIQKIRDETRSTFVDMEGREQPGFPNPTKGQLETIAAIERNIAKQAFDVGIRVIYLAKPENYDGMTVSGITGLFKQFSSEGWNGLKHTGWMATFDDYPWEFNAEHNKNEMREHVVEGFRRRQFFFSPFALPYQMVMSIEELATLFHIPSAAVSAPSLPRLQSATAEAPTNLPT